MERQKKTSSLYSHILVLWNFEFRFLSYLCQLWLIRDLSVVSSGGNRSARRKPPPSPKSLATFLHAQAAIQPQAVVRDNVQIVAAPRTTRRSGQALHILVLYSAYQSIIISCIQQIKNIIRSFSQVQIPEKVTY